MTHLSSTTALVADLEQLSKTIGQLVMDLKNVHTQEAVADVSEKNPRQKQLFDPKQETSSSQTSEESAESAEESKKEITIEQVRAVLAEKSQAGHTAQVKELLEKFGANKLSAVATKDYEALLEAASAIK